MPALPESMSMKRKIGTLNFLQPRGACIDKAPLIKTDARYRILIKMFDKLFSAYFNIDKKVYFDFKLKKKPQDRIKMEWVVFDPLH